ncbi:MAG: beta-lactamase family protein [Kangiellaceae bacterium]|nr:beta-lactamase family protein [Kangiellaceae bacterium]
MKHLILALALILSSNVTAKDISVNEFSKLLESRMKENHIPGMVVGVIQDGKVIYKQAFGFSNVEKQEKVELDTVFAIGSITKSFTSSLVAQLVEEGSLSWETDITDYIDYLDYSPEGRDKLTLEDLLSHKSGFARNDILFVSGNASKEQILKTSVKAIPFTPYGQFNYNNVMYLAAGEIAGKVKNSSWEGLINTVFLKPLNMNNSYLSLENLDGVTIASGYSWDEEAKKLNLEERKSIENIGPAGGIYSNIKDMLNYTNMLLAEGEFKGKAIVSKDAISATRESHTNIAKGIDYGLGWFVRDWQGTKLIEHGGQINGFHAQLSLWPEHNLGYVILTNIQNTPLMQESINLVWGQYGPKDDLAKKQESKPQEDFEKYLGKYEANFASFSDEHFTVLVKDGLLAIDIPRQMVYTLKSPDQEGKRYFTMTDQVAVSFNEKDGKVISLKMHQAGMEFELPKEGMTKKESKKDLQKLIGKYKQEARDGLIEVYLKDNKLRINIPGQGDVELAAPDSAGHRKMMPHPAFSALFEKGQLTVYKNKEKVITRATRLESEAKPAAITIKDVGRVMYVDSTRKFLKEFKPIELIGTIKMLHSGLSGKYQVKFDADSYRQQADYGDFGQLNNIVTKEYATTYGMVPRKEHLGKYHQQLLEKHPLFLLDLEKNFQHFEFISKKEKNGVEHWLVQVKNPGLPALKLMINPASGDIASVVTHMLSPVLGKVKTRIEFGDYREVNGLRIPFKIQESNQVMGTTILELEDFKSSNGIASEFMN